MAPSVAVPHIPPEPEKGRAGALGGSERFSETRWSLVSRVGAGGAEGHAALEELCRLAWVPLFSYARRCGWSAEDAEDAVQSFLATACGKGLFAAARQDRGKLRTFLLTAFKRSLLNERRYRAAECRGGGHPTLSLALASVEEQYHLEFRETESPDRLYHRQWALGVMEAALAALEMEYAETGRWHAFKILADGLEGELPDGGYAAAAAELGLTENATRQAMYRLRVAFRRELWRAVAARLGSTDGTAISRDLTALREALAPD